MKARRKGKRWKIQKRLKKEKNIENANRKSNIYVFGNSKGASK